MAIKKTHIKCSGCGNFLTFDPASQNLKCNTCLSLEEIEKIPSIEKNIYSENIKENIRENATCNCSSCGAGLELKEREITKTCSYCNSGFVVENEEINGLIPDLIIPFQFNKQTAIQKYIEGVKKKHFLPNKFKKSPNLDNILGTYVSSFSFDTNTDSTYSGRLRESHTRRNSKGETETYYTTEYISGQEHYDFYDVVVEASSQINQTYIDSIKPFVFDGTSSYKYDADFLRGYNVESYDTNLHQCKMLSEDIIKERIEDLILSNYHYDSVDYFNLDTTFSNYKYAYVLVPVYFVNFKYNNKDYVACVNGQTGKLGGKLPKSGWKIFFTIFIPILFIALILIGVNLLT